MDLKDTYLADNLYSLTPDEQALMTDTRRNTLWDFIQSVSGAREVSPAHIDYFNSLVRSFSEISNARVLASWGEINFEGNRLLESSSQTTVSQSFSPESVHGKTTWAFNQLSARVSDTGFLATIRPFPVKWHLDHIGERSLQRSGGKFNTDDPMFLKHNALAMAMLRVFEDEFTNGPDVWHPFILPEKSGVLLGHTMHITQRQAGNRVYVTASNDWSQFMNTIAPYERQPTMVMTVRTYFGESEMTPPMKLLRQKLLKHYSVMNAGALTMEMDSYCDTDSSGRYDNDPRADDYIDNVVTLANLMKSPLWDQAVKLPLHMRPHARPAPRIDI